MDRDRIEMRLFGVVFSVFVLLLISSVVVLFLWSKAEDSAARTREEALVSNGLQTRVAQLEHAVAAQVVWDEAITHLDVAYDPVWADANVGEFLNNTSGFGHAFVLNGEGRPIYAMAGSDYSPFSFPVAALVGQVRRAEAKRGPIAHRKPDKTMISSPIQASEIDIIDGRPQILTASLVQPDFGTAYPVGDRAPIVVTVMDIDKAFLDDLANHFLLTGVRVALDGVKSDPDLAYTALKNARGTPVARIAWIPQRPGQALLTKALPGLLAFLALLAMVVATVMRRGRNAANSLMASEARARHMAHHDPLTGLSNRALFTDRLHQATELARRTGDRTAVLCIDLDRFKDVNDTLGHQSGDELIQIAADRLRVICRSTDTLARLGGDEFAIILGDDPKAAASLAGRIVENLNLSVELSAGRVFLGASVGVTVVDASTDAEEALRQADVALYRAKAEGRGQYAFFESEMDSAMKVRRAIEADLRLALADEGQLYMVYQPQVGPNGKMFGLEALVRWDHPQRGALSPAFFVPIAEECGLIDKLGLFTLRRAFRDSLRWPGLKMAVNVSARQIAQPAFPDDLARILAETGARAENLELELSEGLLLGDDPHTHQTLKRLRDMGFSLALDDFGTGYSSLAYLRRYPIDKIKIDRSFIANLGVDQEADAVIRAIVKLARALNLSIIAEGVETQDQRGRLSAVGCNRVQGFIYSKAVGADAIDGLIAQKNLVAA